MSVYEFLVQEQMQEKVQAMELRFQETGELALAKEYSQIYRIVLELFDKFTELLGEEPISMKEYCELLDAGLEEAKVGVIPPSLDQVVVGDVERTRLNHLKVLFFVGANDTLLPGNLGQGGLLSERDRAHFSEKKIALSPGAKEKTYIQKFYLYMNLTKPSDRLILSWAKASGDGKALRPAYLVQDLRRMFPGIAVQDEDARTLSEQELTGRGMAQYLAAGLRNPAAGDFRFLEAALQLVSVRGSGREIHRRTGNRTGNRVGSRTEERSDHRSSGADGAKRSGASA